MSRREMAGRADTASPGAGERVPVYSPHMANAKNQGSEPSGVLVPKLTGSRSATAAALDLQRAQGLALLARLPADDPQGLKAIEDEFLSWYEFTKDLLRKCFSSNAPSRSFVNAIGQPHYTLFTPTTQELSAKLASRLSEGSRQLASLVERLTLFDEEMSEGPSSSHDVGSPSRSVFLVHGRNDRWTQAVARTLEKAGP